jgi:hypothetical protein
MSKKGILMIAVFGVVIVAAAALVIGLRSAASSAAKSGPGCWTTSQDGSVIAQEEVGEVCLDTGTLSLLPADGGDYTRLGGPVSRGPLVCSLTPASGPNTWKVWAAPGASTSEAVNLCRFMKSEGGMATFTWGPGEPPAASASAPQSAPTTGYWYDQGYSYATNNIAPDPSAYSQTGTMASALCADAMFPNPGQGTPEVSPVPGPGLQTREWVAGCESGASSSASQAPAPSPTPAPTYTYQDGYNAASQVTTAAMNSAWNAQDDSGPGGSAPLYWCWSNDPTPGAEADDPPTTANPNAQGTPWFQGCVADMLARGLVTQAEAWPN